MVLRFWRRAACQSVGRRKPKGGVGGPALFCYSVDIKLKGKQIFS